MANTFDYVVKADVVPDPDRRLIRGYATVEDVDRDDEIIDVRSVAKCFREYMETNPIVLRDHDYRYPVGKAVDYHAGKNRLEVTVEIAKGVPYVDETWDLIKQGVLRAFSIRGRPDVVEYVHKNGKRIPKISINDFVELSVVAVGANKASLFEVVAKSVQNTEVNTMSETNQTPEAEPVGNQEDDLLKADIMKEVQSLLDEQMKTLKDTIVETVKSVTKPDPAEAATPAAESQDPGSPAANDLTMEQIQKTVAQTVQDTIAKSAELNRIEKALQTVPGDDEDEGGDKTKSANTPKWGLDEFTAFVRGV